MIGKDEEQEVTFKVADRRKFNADGSVKEGVTLDAEPPTVPKPEPAAAKTSEPASATDDIDLKAITLDDEEPEDEADDLPGVKDPASFVNFLSTLATNAAAALGAVPHPATGKRSLDLETGKYWLDVLAMVKEKTKGNLHEKEQ